MAGGMVARGCGRLRGGLSASGLVLMQDLSLLLLLILIGFRQVALDLDREPF